MYARHVTIKGDPTRLDEAIRTQRDVVLPVLHGCAGFAAQLVMVDRPSGEIIGMSIWETERDMHASEEAMQGVRRAVASSIGASDPPVVRVYELAVFDRPS